MRWSPIPFSKGKRGIAGSILFMKFDKESFLQAVRSQKAQGMNLDSIHEGDQVIVYQPVAEYYKDKVNQALADPTAVGFDGIVRSIGKNRDNEDIIWIQLQVDSSMIECYPGELVPYWGYSAADIRTAPDLPGWVYDKEELIDKLYQFEWKKEDWDVVFEHMFKDIAEVRKHLDWLKRQP